MKDHKILKLIIISIIILVNIVWIFSSIIMIFRGDYFLNVNSSNINELVHFLPDYHFSQNLKSIQYSQRVRSKAHKVLVNLALRCIRWYIWCAQFFNFVNLCDFGLIFVGCVPILSPIILINLWRF